jgi:hypothetical protein
MTKDIQKVTTDWDWDWRSMTSGNGHCTNTAWSTALGPESSRHHLDALTSGNTMAASAHTNTAKLNRECKINPVFSEKIRSFKHR